MCLSPEEGTWTVYHSHCKPLSYHLNLLHLGTVAPEFWLVYLLGKHPKGQRDELAAPTRCHHCSWS